MEVEENGHDGDAKAKMLMVIVTVRMVTAMKSMVLMVMTTVMIHTLIVP